AEDGIRDFHVTGVQTCALPICVTGNCNSACPNRTALASRFGVRFSADAPALSPVRRACNTIFRHQSSRKVDVSAASALNKGDNRSDERRVGKECSTRWQPAHTE